MNRRLAMTLLVLVSLLMLSAAATAAAQRPASPPLPPGKRIVAQDGDVVVVDNDARVRIVRRREGFVRVVFNAQEGWLVLLVDHDTPAGPADGRVDVVHFRRDVAGSWPFDPRWEGRATIEDYSMASQGGSGLGLVTPQGLVQLLLGMGPDLRDADAVAVLSSSSGGSTAVDSLAFDEAEPWYIAELRRNDGVVRSPDGGSSSTSIALGATGRGASISPGKPSGAASGNARGPVKIVDVPPVLPEQAARSGIRGTVLLEITIDTAGTVTDARVLRGVPLLDAAALEAVRQWRYEPTTMFGKPVPVTVTVAVVF